MSAERDIALALSGGGYRAAHFHLGVLWRLHERGLLDRVGTVSSVSGGSIVAGMYATELVRHDSFDFARFLDRVQKFLNRRIPFDVIAQAQDLVPWSSSGKGLERRFTRLTSGGRRPIMMSDLAAVSPRFVFNATAVHSGAAWRFLPGGVAQLWDMGRTHSAAYEPRFIEYDCDVPLGKAMAASAAFPTFSAVTIPRERIVRRRASKSIDLDNPLVVPQLRDELPDPLYLSDGGVVDNVGVTSILCGQAPTDQYYLIASDASAALDIGGYTSAGRVRKLKYLMRQFDIRGNHNNLMTSFLAIAYHRREIPTKGVAMLQIGLAVPHATCEQTPNGTCGADTLDRAKDLSSIPTRLRRIPSEDRKRLMDHGANMLWSRLTEYTDLLPSKLEMVGATKKG